MGSVMVKEEVPSLAELLGARRRPAGISFTQCEKCEAKKPTRNLREWKLGRKPMTD